MAFKMKQGASPNFKDLGSAASFPKKKKTLGTREDNVSEPNADGSSPTVNTLTKTNTRTGKQKTKDISQKRADNIRDRQNKKNPLQESDILEGNVTEEDEKIDEKVDEKSKTPTKDKYPAVGTQERYDFYEENDLKQDETTAGPWSDAKNQTPKTTNQTPKTTNQTPKENPSKLHPIELKMRELLGT